jgi:hypothetical protein
VLSAIDLDDEAMTQTYEIDNKIFAWRLAPEMIEHDPEKREPIFGKDHAQTRSWTMMAIQPDRIMV